jgi:sugar transferase EpsL
MDVFFAAAVLTLCSPLIAVISILIWFVMGWPVLFTQVRAGFHGRPFKLFKFRTMRDAQDGQGRLLPDSERLTKLGIFLRRFSLDELPQFWNVIIGDLSIVGPRPLLVDYLPRYSLEQGRRHDVKPGITGWAQVNGRNAIDWNEKFKLDVWYADHWSLWLDVRVIFRTAWHVLAGHGITFERHASMPEFMGMQEQGGREWSK